ncbi:MAG: gliding motility protein GldC [Crocinitomicaceae bacterium]|nr:gliding motility protein GldC [Crocinitomicaceae bacterium]
MRSSNININVSLDENNIPEKIEWSANDAGVGTSTAKAMILSLWDKENRNAMRIDLWTKEMEVEEMKFFVHQTILTLADNFERATGESKMASAMRDFCGYYAEKLNISGSHK